MICPRWVYTRIQPIAIQNVLDYLVAALQHPKSAGQIIEIGGEDILTYGGLMKTYARVRGLNAPIARSPFDAQAFLILGASGDAVFGRCGAHLMKDCATK